MRFLLVFTVLACAAPSTFAETSAQPTPSALAAAYECAEIADDSARLACYDTTIDRLRQAETSGEIVAVDRVQVATIERESFGFTLPSLASLMPRVGRTEARTALDSLAMQVARVIERPTGRLSFVMADGQAWTQAEPQRTRNVHVGDTVTVRRAALGSFMLWPPGGGAGHRVRREN